MNIASMAGLATGLGTINEVGYTAAKHGVVALTRSFETSKPSVDIRATRVERNDPNDEKKWERTVCNNN